MCSPDSNRYIFAGIYVLIYSGNIFFAFTQGHLYIYMVVTSTLQVICCACLFKSDYEKYKNFLIYVPPQEESEDCGYFWDKNDYICVCCTLIVCYMYGICSFLLSFFFILAFFIYFYKLHKRKQQSIEVFPLPRMLTTVPEIEPAIVEQMVPMPTQVEEIRYKATFIQSNIVDLKEQQTLQQNQNDSRLQQNIFYSNIIDPRQQQENIQQNVLDPRQQQTYFQQNSMNSRFQQVFPQQNIIDLRYQQQNLQQNVQGSGYAFFPVHMQNGNQIVLQQHQVQAGYIQIPIPTQNYNQ